MGEVAELAVHRDEALRAGQRQQRLELLPLGVPAHVDLRPGPEWITSAPEPAQPVDDLADVGLVAGDGVRGQHHQVAVAHRDPPVVGGRHEGQGRHGLALGAGRDDADPPGVEVADPSRCRPGWSSGMRSRPMERASATFLPIDRPEGGHGPPVGDGGVGDLLDPVDVAGEAGHDDPLVGVGGEELGQHRARPALAVGVALLLGVGRVRQQQPDPRPVGQGPDPGQVGGPAVDRRQVDLEVPGVQDHALGGVEGGGEAVRHRVGDGDELHVERADLAPLAVARPG